jgi:hypothetical protein
MSIAEHAMVVHVASPLVPLVQAVMSVLAIFVVVVAQLVKIIIASPTFIIIFVLFSN